MVKELGRDASKEEIQKAANALMGHKLKDIGANLSDINSTKIKGKPGEILEEYFGMENDNYGEPDFRKARLELKCKPLKISWGDYFRPKEPLSIGMIDYEEVANTENWRDIKKLRVKLLNLMIVWFVHDEEDLDNSEFIWWQIGVDLKEFEDDIQEEYEEIRRQILEGEHLSQEKAGNDILQTCPKHNYDFANRERGSYVVNSGHPKLDKPERRSWRIPTRFLVKMIAESAGIELVEKSGYQYVRIEDLREKSKEKAELRKIENYV